MKTADFRKKMPVKKYFPIKKCKQLSLLGKHEPDRKRTSYKHYKLVFCHKTLHIHANPRETKTSKSGRGGGGGMLDISAPVT